MSVSPGAGVPRISPPTTPFVQELPFPPRPQPTPPFSCPESRGFITDRTQFYQLVQEQRLARFHPQLPLTLIWGYRDANWLTWPFVLGPTFTARMNRGNILNVFNNLPTAPATFGEPRTTLHLHGGHHEARSDGFPILDFSPCESLNYCYPMLDAGFAHGQPAREERPSTNWYYDHLLDFAGANVYRGLSGFYLVFDELDSGNEQDSDPGALRLPSGPFDIPLMLQDRCFNSDGSLFYDPSNREGMLGDKLIVNGAIQPRLLVKRRKYRFRILNGSNARVYQLFLSGRQGKRIPFTAQIGNSGGLFSRPIRDVTDLQVGPAQRVEVILDFTLFQSGEELFLENRLAQEDGRKPTGLLERGPALLKFIVGEEASDPSRVPEQLRPLPAVTPQDLNAATRHTLEFGQSGAGRTINGQAAFLDKPLLALRANKPYVFTLNNKSDDCWYPIHFHSEFMRVLRRNDAPPPVAEQDGISRTDTLILRENEKVEVFLRFRDYQGKFTVQSQNLEHQKMFMLARFDVI